MLHGLRGAFVSPATTYRRISSTNSVDHPKETQCLTHAEGNPCTAPVCLRSRHRSTRARTANDCTLCCFARNRRLSNRPESSGGFENCCKPRISLDSRHHHSAGQRNEESSDDTGAASTE